MDAGMRFRASRDDIQTAGQRYTRHLLEPGGVKNSREGREIVAAGVEIAGILLAAEHLDHRPGVWRVAAEQLVRRVDVRGVEVLVGGTREVHAAEVLEVGNVDAQRAAGLEDPAPVGE